MNIFLRSVPLSCVLAAAIVSGCAVPQAVPEAETRTESAASKGKPAEAPPAPPVQSADQVALTEGINLYNNGDYNDAIKRLGGAGEIWVGGPKSAQTAAFKYMAFSYCVTGRKTLCRQQFEKALRLDPAFDLAPGENGHPLWGPVFARAKKGK